MEEGAKGDEGEHGSSSSYGRGEAGDVGIGPNCEKEDDCFEPLHTREAVEGF